MPSAIRLFELCIALIDNAPDSAITAGIDRSILPGPLVITSIWPNDTRTVKVEKLSAVVSREPMPGPPLPALNNAVARRARIAAIQVLSQ